MNMDNVEDIYRLSPMQQGMLFHTLHAPESGVYFEQLGLELRNELDVPAFKRAWQWVLDRHPALRSGFLWEGLEEPLQVVYRALEMPWIEDDWRGLDATAQRERFDALLGDERARGLELSQAPLMRCLLLRTSDESWRWVWNYHHLLTDGWSTSNLMGELFAGYAAFSAGREPATPRPRPYRDYIAWLQRQDRQQAEQFWRARLEGFLEATPLVVDQTTASPTEPGERHVQRSFTLPTALGSGLEQLARTHRVTPSALFQGAWALLLSRYSGRLDVLFGAAVSGRPVDLPGAENMVGLFINTVPVRVRVAPDLALPQWLESLQIAQAEGEHHSYTPLADIQAWSQLGAGSPLFHSVMVVENYPLDADALERSGGLAIGEMQSLEQTNYPLTVAINPGPDATVEFCYREGRFDTQAIERLAGHLQTLLAGMVANSTGALSELPMLTPSERRQLLVDWNNTDVTIAEARLVHQQFEARAAQTPEAIALIANDTRLSYAALNARANRLAHFLRGLGVGPEVPVGICLHRSTDAVIALLATLKAGGAYVPIDAAYPSERIARMLRGSRVPYLLTTSALAGELGEADTKTVCLDLEGAEIEAQPDRDPPNDAQPSNLAYVIFTSGSTGASKGAMVTHGGLLNTSLAWRDTFELDLAPPTCLQTAGFSFDVFSTDVIRALCNGGKLVICPDRLLTQPADLYELMRAQSVTVADLVPALVRKLVAYLEDSGQRLDFLRLLVVGSDRWYVREYDQVRALCAPETAVVNAYGATEVSMDCSFFAGPTDGLAAIDPVPIGRPFPNTRLYPLDGNLEPVPVGVPGELHVAGHGVARGYYADAALTRARFIADPFSQDPSARLYKTGDLACFLPDGNLKLLGRIDHQVKIRGVRIDPSEVEAALLRHGAVRESVVVSREDDAGQLQLVAYLVAGSAEPPSVDELRAFLGKCLPGAMMPAAFMVLDSLPLNPSGKIDRRALPRAEVVAADRTGAVAPRSPCEQRLAEIWASVLGLNEVGIHDNFFGLGGDSIRSIQVVARATDAGIPITPRHLFQNQTVAELAAAVDARADDSRDSQVDGGALALIPHQRRLLEQAAEAPEACLESLWLEAQVGVDREQVSGIVGELVHRHDALRLRFSQSDNGWRQAVCREAEDQKSIFSAVDLSAVDPGDRQAALASEAAAARERLSLSSGPLFRVTFFDLGPDVPARVLIVAHPLVLDHESLPVVLSDWHEIDAELVDARERQVPLAGPTFATAIEQIANAYPARPAQAERNHWLALSRQSFAPLPKEFEAVSGAMPEGTSEQISIELDTEETRALTVEAPPVYQTEPGEILLTALAHAVGAWTGAPSLLVDVIGSWRERVEDRLDLSRTVGPFTRVYPAAFQVPPNDPGEALKSVKEQLRAIPEGGRGYEALRYHASDPELDVALRASPQAELCFGYLGTEAAALPPGARFRVVTGPRGGSLRAPVSRHYPLQVRAQIDGDRLRVDWSYRGQIHRHETVSALAQNFTASLRALLAHCQTPKAGGYTPSDFPDTHLSQEDLDHLVGQYGGN